MTFAITFHFILCINSVRVYENVDNFNNISWVKRQCLIAEMKSGNEKTWNYVCKYVFSSYKSDTISTHSLCLEKERIDQ